MDFRALFYVCPLLFIAGVVDGISGGGGLIAFPTYLMTGMPVQAAYGCNKLQSCVGTSLSAGRYFKSGFIDLKLSSISAALAVLGSFFSTKIIFMLNTDIIKIIVLICIPGVIALMFIRRGIRGGVLKKTELSPKNIFLGMCIGLILGLYDGFFGPGAGTIAMILYSTVLSLDMRAGAGNGKIVIIISNLIALTHYIAVGSIVYEIAIPATISNAAGCYVGAGFAVKKGEKLILPVMFGVVAVVTVQTCLKLFIK